MNQMQCQMCDAKRANGQLNEEFNCYRYYSKLSTAEIDDLEWNKPHIHTMIESLSRRSQTEIVEDVEGLLILNDCEGFRLIVKLCPYYIDQRDLDDYIDLFDMGRCGGHLYLVSPKILKLFQEIGLKPKEETAFRLAILHRRDKPMIDWCLQTYARDHQWFVDFAVKMFNDDKEKNTLCEMWVFETLKKYHREKKIMPKIFLKRRLRITWTSGLSCDDQSFYDKLMDDQQQAAKLAGVCCAFAPMRLPDYVLLWITEWYISGPMTHFEQITLIQKVQGFYREKHPSNQ